VTECRPAEVLKPNTPFLQYSTRQAGSHIAALEDDNELAGLSRCGARRMDGIRCRRMRYGGIGEGERQSIAGSARLRTPLPLSPQTVLTIQTPNPVEVEARHGGTCMTVRGGQSRSVSPRGNGRSFVSVLIASEFCRGQSRGYGRSRGQQHRRETDTLTVGTHINQATALSDKRM
jgi:hypothetical protein